MSISLSRFSLIKDRLEIVNETLFPRLSNFETPISISLSNSY